MLEKLLTRTELQLTIGVIAIILLNHFVKLGMSVDDILALVAANSGYAVSRGLAKTESRSDKE